MNWSHCLRAALKSNFLFAAALILGATPLFADPLDNWERIYPELSGYQGGRLFFGNGKWLELRGEVGRFGDGEIYHSTDGLAWSKSKVPPGFVPTSAAYANGLWVVTGQEGMDGIDMFSAIVTSADGIVWEKQAIRMDQWRVENINPWINRVVYGGELWIAMGSKGRYLTSADGVSWTPKAISGNPSVYHISYGNGKWLVLSGHGWDYGSAYISSNGIDWVAQDFPMWVTSAAFGDGQWVAIVYGETENSIRTSTDGIEWVTRQIIPRPQYQLEGQRFQVEYADSRWLIAGTERTAISEQGPWRAFTFTSSDGLEWNRSDIPTTPILEQTQQFTFVRYGEGLWLLSGQSYGGEPELFSSTDALNWTSRMERVNTSFSELTYGAGQWMAAGESVIAASPDGRNWTNVYSLDGAIWKSVIEANGRWMACGHQPTGPSYESIEGVILTSATGSEWSLALNGISESTFNGIAFGDGLWVAVGWEVRNDIGHPVLVTSRDGLDWIKRTVPALSGATLNTPIFANGRWIVVGSRWTGSTNGLWILTSTDGVNWSNVTDLEGYFNRIGHEGVYFANGVWIVTTMRGDPDLLRPTTVRSTNGVDWVVHDLDIQFSVNDLLTSVTHADGKWIIGGWVSRGRLSYGALWSSEDGEHWTEHLGVGGESLASDGKRLLGLWGGVVSASERFLPALPPVLSVSREEAEFSLWLNGEIGEQYDIEQTLNFAPRGWAHLQSVTLTNASQRILLNPPARASGFWRARTL